MRKLNILLIITFLIPLFFFGVLSVVDVDPEKSELENRSLTPMPELSVKNYLSSVFARKFEEFYSDTFPFRNFLISANRKLNEIYYASGYEGVFLPEVKKGKKIYGLIVTDNNAMENFMFSEELVNNFAENIEYFSSQIPEKKVYLLIPPSACEFYAPEKYKTDDNSQKKAFEFLESNLTDTIFVDAYSEIEKHSYEYVYYRTDHHWTARGAYYAYEAFAKNAQFETVPLSNLESGYIENFLGTIYKTVSKYSQSEKLEENPDFIEYFIPEVSYTAFSYKSTDMKSEKNIKLINEEFDEDNNMYSIFMGGDSALVKIKTDLDNGKKIVIVKDSYGNAFLPFLAHNYEEIYALDPRYFNAEDKPELNLTEFVNSVGAEEVLFINYSMFVSEGYWFNWIDVVKRMQ